MYTERNDPTQRRTPLKVVESKNPGQIEREIDQYVKSIRTLISKLSPSERQKYYNGLLAFILNEQIEMTSEANMKTIENSDFTRLSARELNLLEELSMRMQHLYRTIGHDTE